MRVALIFNPKAGKAQSISAFLVELGPDVRCEVFPVSGPEHIHRALAEIRSSEFERVIAAGGDGTLGQIVNCLAPEFPPLELALLPVGTGNDLARSLGVRDFAVAVEHALTSPAVAMDAVRLERGDERSWFVNVANGGLGGRVAGEVCSEDKKRWGAFAYWMSTASALADRTGYRTRLVLDGREVEIDSLGLAVANGRFVGGGFPMAGSARMDDGLLNVVCVPRLPALELVGAGVDFTLGRNQESERVLTYQARRVEVRSEPVIPFSIDGELIECDQVAFEVEPGALHIVAGPESPALGKLGEVSSLLPKPEEGMFAQISAVLAPVARGVAP